MSDPILPKSFRTHCVRCICLTIFLVQAPKLKVAIAPPRIVELVGICDLGDNRARVFGERVEEDAVSDDSKDLGFYVLASPDLEASQNFSFRNFYIAHAPVCSVKEHDLHRRLRRRAGCPAMQVHVVG